jgi:hypothetical protein
MECYRGIWISCNRFVTEYGTELRVVPFNQFVSRWESKFPLRCFILLEGNTVKDIVEDNIDE